MQVSEILTEDKTRLSVNGWFHGPIVPRPDRYVESPLPLKPYVEIEVMMMFVHYLHNVQRTMISRYMYFSAGFFDKMCFLF